MARAATAFLGLSGLLVANALPVTKQQQQVTLAVSADVSNEFAATVSQQHSGLVNGLSHVMETGFRNEVAVSITDSRGRKLQTGTPSLQVSYVIHCGVSCDDVMVGLSTVTTNTAFAQAMIDAVNMAATGSGFATAVVTQSAADVAAAVVVPELVTVIIPTFTPSPAPPPGTPVAPPPSPPPAPAAPVMIIKGVLDLQTPQRGSSGKSIQLLAITDVPDLSVFGLGVANNGNAPSRPCLQCGRNLFARMR